MSDFSTPAVQAVSRPRTVCASGVRTGSHARLARVEREGLHLTPQLWPQSATEASRTVGRSSSLPFQRS